jgi:hypothetical protein
LFGPIYQEAAIIEEKCEQYDRAISIAEKGLIQTPRVNLLLIYNYITNNFNSSMDHCGLLH